MADVFQSKMQYGSITDENHWLWTQLILNYLFLSQWSQSDIILWVKYIQLKTELWEKN